MTKDGLNHIFFNLSLTTKVYFLITVFFLLPSLNKIDSQNKFKTVIDAGHGGKDPGRPNSYGVKEKDIALKIALILGKKLKDNGNDVIFTRDKDVFLTLRERAKIANQSDADLFISIHCNAWHKESVYGTETFVYGLHVNDANFQIALKENEVIFLEDDYEKNYKGFDPNSPESLIGLTLMQEEYLDQSILLASFIQDNFTKNLKRKNRGVKQSGFWVLHNTYMPSVLIETGFMTNIKEGKYLNSTKGQNELANSIYNAILEYKKVTNYEIQDYKIDEIIYKIQIAAGLKSIDPEPYNFNGLKNISRIKYGKLYKYFYSNSADIDKIKKDLAYVKSKGFNSAFIVKFKNQELITND